MDLSTFEDMLDLYGGDLALWPGAFRVQAESLVASSPEAWALRAAMAEVEAVLRRPSVPGDGAAIVARATRQRQETRMRVIATRAGWAAAAIVVLALGLSIGGLTSPPEAGTDNVIAAAFDAGGGADVD